MKSNCVALKIVAFVSGTVIMILEILGFRVLSPYFGYSVYVSGSLIGIVMIGLSLGYYLGGQLADRRPSEGILYKIIFAADIYVILISFFYLPLLHSFTRFGVIYGSVISSFVLFAPSILLLGMVPPFIIRLLTKDPSVVGSIAGDITAIGTVGSIIGTFGATFLLIPGIGSHYTMYLCSVLLLLISVWGLTRQRKRYALLLLIIFVFNLFPPATDSDILYQKESLYNLVKVKKNKDNKMALLLNNNDWQHSFYDPNSKLTGMYFDYFNIAPILTKAKEILVLGMGAGTSTKQFLEFFDAHVDAVEIDPTVIEVGKQYFGVPESDRLKIYIGDARPFLNNTEKKYDVIELDVYHGGVYVPFYILTREFFQEAYDHLSDNGMLAVNVLSLLKKEKGNLLVETIGKTIGSVFPSVYQIGMLSNHILFGTKGKPNLFALRDRLVSYKGEPEMEFIARYAATGLYYFDEKADSVIFTDDKAPVEEITYEMMSSKKKQHLTLP